MGDLYDPRRDRSEKSFRYPLYERLLWVVGLVAIAGVIIGWNRLAALYEEDARRGLAVTGIVVLVILVCFWISFRGWQSKIIISHRSLKARYLGQGVARISWDHIEEVLYIWRPLGHKLTFIGTDGATVTFRSSISGYDELMLHIYRNAPEGIAKELEELFGEEQFEEDDDGGDQGDSDHEGHAPD